jgi:hypothetical protein
MPNTLVHLGIQGLGNRLVSKSIDLKWVFLGCIIPDLPWIFRRLIMSLDPGINIYDLRLYSVVQASLFFCLLLAFAFALVSEKPRLVFVILAVNSLVHLLLDTVEIKWGNGVHLLAPLNWQLLNFGLVWPDSVLIAVLSLPGLVIGIWVLAHPVSTPIRVLLRPNRYLVAVVVLVSLYAFGPLAFLDGPYSTNINSIATLQEKEHRVGKEVRMDREIYQQRDDGDVVITFAHEPLRVVGDIRAEKSSRVSLIGEFVDVDTIRINYLHEYQTPWRDLASYTGLGLFAIVWVVAFVRERRSQQ